jgi:hypothetical protein
MYDASSLTDGNTYTDIAKPIQGDMETFILRRIIGVNTVVDTAANGGRFNYKNASRSYANGNTSTGIIMPKVWPVLPEKEYKVNETIFFDLYKVLRDFSVCAAESTIYNSFIAFMGVKRLNGAPYGTQTTGYAYRELTQQFLYNLTINWSHFTTGTTVAPARRFQIQMSNLDFQLLSIRIAKQTGASGALQTNDFMITLYDQYMHALSDAPVPQSYYNSARVSSSQAPLYSGLTPVPPLVYPAQSYITFDITSMLCSTQLNQNYQIVFDGIWRFPL